MTKNIKQPIRSVAGEMLVKSGTRDAAVQISKFARRPLYWGDELIAE